MAIKAATPTNQGTPSACPVLLHGVPAVAKALGVGTTFANVLIKEGRIKSVLLGRRRLVPDQELKAFVASLQKEA